MPQLKDHQKSQGYNQPDNLSARKVGEAINKLMRGLR